MSKKAVIVYVDGYNLYYGLAKPIGCKWVDLQGMFEAELGRLGGEVVAVKFFTAIARGADASARHRTYIRALETGEKVSVVYGNHKWQDCECEVARCTHEGDRWFERSEEKQTDVNLAVSMVTDAYARKCDLHVLVSGDSDYIGAIKHIRSLPDPPQVLALVPSLGKSIDRRGARASVELRDVCDGSSDLPPHWLVNHQFSERVEATNGTVVSIPRTWRIASMPELKQLLKALSREA